VFIYCYRQDSVVAEREAILTREKRETRLLDSLQRSLKDMQSKKKYLFAEETKKKSGLLRQISDLQVRKQSEKEKLDAKLRQRINSINNSRLVLNRGEADELRKIQQTFGYEINRLNKQISSLAQAESDEILRTLQAKQKQFLADYLSKYRIIDADISGVGDKLKSRLRASAIFTAADIEYWRVTSVEGIGSNKGNALVRWRDSLVSRARGQMSTSLTQSEVNTIKKRYELQKHQLENQRDEMQRRLTGQEGAIRDQYVPKGKALDAEQLDTQTKAAQELQLITNKYDREHTSLSEKASQLDTEIKIETQRIDEDMGKLQKQMFDCHWQLAKSRREIKAFENLSFRNYIWFVLSGRKAGLNEA